MAKTARAEPETSALTRRKPERATPAPAVDMRARYSVEQKQQALDALRAGKSLNEASELSGVSYQTVLNIANKHGLHTSKRRGASMAATPTRAADPLASVLSLLDDPSAVAKLEAERARLVERLEKIDRLLGALKPEK